MNVSFNNIQKDRITFLSMCIALSLIILYLFYLLFFFAKLPPFVPIFNQLPWGESRIGVKAQLFIPFGIILTILFVNSFFSSYMYEKIPLVSRILCITALLISFLALLFLIRTIGLLL